MATAGEFQGISVEIHSEVNMPNEVELELRVAIHMRAINCCEPMHVLKMWLDRLRPDMGGINGCIYLSGPARLSSSDCDLALEFCWHVLSTPDSLDSYAQHFSKRHPWTPWGTKSGPNFQFFEILNLAGTQHTETWTLLIEEDCRPKNDAPGLEILKDLELHENSWMIGGLPDPAIAPRLPHELRNHLNGAALYRASDHAFREFLTAVWLPGLLEMIALNERYAFDCLTSPEVFESLSPVLRSAWNSQRSRFTSVEGIQNLSTIEVDGATWLPTLPSNAHARESRKSTPWMVHAKGFDPLARH